MILANMCTENAQQSRTVLSIPNLIDKLRAYLAHSSPTFTDKTEFLRLICNPISTLSANDLLIYLTQFPILQTLLEFVLSYSGQWYTNTFSEINIIDSIERAISRILT
jgi:hypothetical protein